MHITPTTKLPQLQKLDDIPITDEERDKAEKKLSGNLGEDEDGNDEEEDDKEENKNGYNQNHNQRSDKKNYAIRSNHNNNEDNEENNFYGNNNNARKVSNKKNNIRQGRSNMYDNEEQDDDDFKPKNKAQSNKYNDIYNNYDERPLRANSGMVPKHQQYKNMNHNKYDEDYGEKSEKKKENSNILNCVINLLKELSPNELQIVKREIDRLNY